MKSALRIAALVAMSLGVGGCAAPLYVPTAGEKIALLKTGDSKAAYTWACVAGKQHRLQPDAKGYAPIPADGGRVTVGTWFYAQGGGGMFTVAYSCAPRASVVPIAGARYYLEFEQEADMCRAMIFKEDAKSRTGLAFEPTYAPSRECAQR